MLDALINVFHSKAARFARALAPSRETVLHLVSIRFRSKSKIADGRISSRSVRDFGLTALEQVRSFTDVDFLKPHFLPVPFIVFRLREQGKPLLRNRAE